MIWLIGCAIGFVIGLIVGGTALFLWVGETLGRAIERAEKRIAYRVRHDDFVRNDYRSEL